MSDPYAVDVLARPLDSGIPPAPEQPIQIIAPPAEDVLATPAPPPVAVPPRPEPGTPQQRDVPVTPARPVTIKGYEGTWTNEQVRNIRNFSEAKTVKSYVNYARALGDTSLDGYDISDEQIKANPTLGRTRDTARMRLNFRVWLDQTGRADMFEKGTDKDIINEFADQMYPPIPNITRNGVNGTKRAPEAEMLAQALAGEARSPYYRRVPSADEFDLAYAEQGAQADKEASLEALRAGGTPLDPLPPNATINEDGETVAGDKRPFDDVVSVRVPRSDGVWSIEKREEWDKLVQSDSREAVLRRAEIVSDLSLDPRLGKPADDRILFWQYAAQQGYTSNLSKADMDAVVNEFVNAQFGDEVQPVLNTKGEDTGKVKEPPGAKALRANLVGLTTSPMNKYRVPEYDELEAARDKARDDGDSAYLAQYNEFQRAELAAKRANGTADPEPGGKQVEGDLISDIYNSAVAAVAAGGQAVASLGNFILSPAGYDGEAPFDALKERIETGSTAIMTESGRQTKLNLQKGLSAANAGPLVDALLKWDLDAANVAWSQLDFDKPFESIGFKEGLMLLAQVAGYVAPGGAVGAGVKTTLAASGTVSASTAALSGLGTAAVVNTIPATVDTIAAGRKAVAEMNIDILKHSDLGVDAITELTAQGYTNPTDEQIRTEAVSMSGSLSRGETWGIIAANLLGNVFGPAAVASRTIVRGTVNTGIGRLAQGSLDATVGGGSMLAQGYYTNEARKEAGLDPEPYGADALLGFLAGGVMGALTGGKGKPKPEPKPEAAPDLGNARADETGGVNADLATAAAERTAREIAANNTLVQAQRALVAAQQSFDQTVADLADPAKVGVDAQGAINNRNAAATVLEQAKAAYYNAYRAKETISNEVAPLAVDVTDDSVVTQGDEFAYVNDDGIVEYDAPVYDWNDEASPDFYAGVEDMRPPADFYTDSEGNTAGYYTPRFRPPPALLTGPSRYPALPAPDTTPRDFYTDASGRTVHRTYRPYEGDAVEIANNLLEGPPDRLALPAPDGTVPFIDRSARSNDQFDSTRVPLNVLNDPRRGEVFYAPDVRTVDPLAAMGDEGGMVAGRPPLRDTITDDPLGTMDNEGGMYRPFPARAKEVKAVADAQTAGAAERAVPRPRSKRAAPEPEATPDNVGAVRAAAEGKPVRKDELRAAAAKDLEAIRKEASRAFDEARDAVNKNRQPAREDALKRAMAAASMRKRMADEMTVDAYLRTKAVPEPTQSADLIARQEAAAMQRAAEESVGIAEARPVKVELRRPRARKPISRDQVIAAVKANTKDVC